MCSFAKNNPFLSVMKRSIIILIISLVLNALFISWFTYDVAVNHVTVHGPTRKALYIRSSVRHNAMDTINNYIKAQLPGNIEYIPIDWKFERAYVCAENELSCARAASYIIGARREIINEQASLQNIDRMSDMSPDNFSSQLMRGDTEKRILEYRQNIQDAEHTIRFRDTSRDGRILGLSVALTYTLRNGLRDQETITERFIVTPNGKVLLMQQSLDDRNPQNYYRASQVIREVLAD